jgi:hypothetical protein
VLGGGVCALGDCESGEGERCDTGVEARVTEWRPQTCSGSNCVGMLATFALTPPTLLPTAESAETRSFSIGTSRRHSLYKVVCGLEYHLLYV